MRRFRPRQYAAALTELLHGATSAQARATIGQFVAMLARHRRLREAPRIITAVSQQLDAASNTVVATVRTVSPLTPSIRAAVTTIARQIALDAKHVTLEEIIDPALIGGIQITVGDTRIDASVAQSIQQLRQQINSAS